MAKRRNPRNGGSLEIDASDFFGGIRKLTQATRPAAIKSMGQAGMQVLNDTVMEIPTVPLDEGRLRGSGSVLVENHYYAVSTDTYGNGTPSLSDNAQLKRSTVTVTVGFNTDYAAQIHEGLTSWGTPVQNWTTQGSGAKYLENKLFGDGEFYFRIAGAIFKRELGL